MEGHAAYPTGSVSFFIPTVLQLWHIPKVRDAVITDVPVDVVNFVFREPAVVKSPTNPVREYPTGVPTTKDMDLQITTHGVLASDRLLRVEADQVPSNVVISELTTQFGEKFPVFDHPKRTLFSTQIFTPGISRKCL